MEAKEKKSPVQMFRKPVCAECAKELPPRKTDYDQQQRRLYCEDCAAIGEVKDNWKPLAGGTVSRVFFIKDKEDPRDNT